MHFQAHLLRNILEGFEYAQDSLLVALLDCIKSLLRDLATDDAFTSHAESVLEVKGYDGILWEVVRKMWSAFVDAGKKSNVCSAFMEVVFLRQNFACQASILNSFALAATFIHTLMRMQTLRVCRGILCF